MALFALPYLLSGDHARQKRINVSMPAEWYFDSCQQRENVRENV